MNNSKKGANIALVIVIAAVLSVLVLGFMTTSSMTVNTVANRRDLNQAYYDAKSVNEAMHDILTNSARSGNIYSLFDKGYVYNVSGLTHVDVDLEPFELPSGNEANVELVYNEKKASNNDYDVTVDIHVDVNGQKYSSQIYDQRKPARADVNYPIVRRSGEYVLCCLAGINGSGVSLKNFTAYGAVFAMGNVGFKGDIKVKDFAEYQEAGYEDDGHLKNDDIITYGSNNTVNCSGAGYIEANFLDCAKGEEAALSSAEGIQFYYGNTIDGNVTSNRQIKLYGGYFPAGRYVYANAAMVGGYVGGVNQFDFNGTLKAKNAVSTNQWDCILGATSRVYAKTGPTWGGPHNADNRDHMVLEEDGWIAVNDVNYASAWADAMYESDKMRAIIEYNDSVSAWSHDISAYTYIDGVPQPMEHSMFWMDRPAVMNTYVSMQHSWDFWNPQMCPGIPVLTSSDSNLIIGPSGAPGVDIVVEDEPNQDVWIGVSSNITISQITLSPMFSERESARVFIYVLGGNTITLGNPGTGKVLTVEDNKNYTGSVTPAMEFNNMPLLERLKNQESTSDDEDENKVVQTRLTVIAETGNSHIIVADDTTLLARLYAMGASNSMKFGANSKLYGRATVFNMSDSDWGGNVQLVLVPEYWRGDSDEYPSWPQIPEGTIEYRDPVAAGGDYDHAYRFNHTMVDEVADDSIINWTHYKSEV